MPKDKEQQVSVEIVVNNKHSTDVRAYMLLAGPYDSRVDG